LLILIILRRAILAFIVVVSINHPSIAESTFIRDGYDCVIELTAEIVDEDVAFVGEQLNGHSCDSIEIFLKNSPGGAAALYDLLYSYFNSNKLRKAPTQLKKVHVEGYCFSVCAMVFLGLPTEARNANSGNCDAIVSVHKAYFPYFSLPAAEAVINQEYVEKLLTANVPEVLVDAFIRTSGEELSHFSLQELSKEFPRKFNCRQEPLLDDEQDFQLALDGLWLDVGGMLKSTRSFFLEDIVGVQPYCSPHNSLAVQIIRGSAISFIDDKAVMDFRLKNSPEEYLKIRKCMGQKVFAAFQELSKQWYVHYADANQFMPLFHYLVLKSNGIRKVDFRLFEVDGSVDPLLVLEVDL